jgi:hypothetical protein
MNCRNIHDQLPDVAMGTPAPPEVEAHLASCRDCAETLQALRATMNLLDEWKAPEPSPFWDVRMQARLREEQQKAASGWLQWLRRPALSVAAALSLVVGIGLYQAGRFMRDSENLAIGDHPAAFSAPTGSPAADLQFLEKNSDLLQNFDALDDLDGDDDADTNN